MAEFCITSFVLQPFLFLTGFWLSWKNILQWNFFIFSNINFRTNMSANQTDLQFEISKICLQTKLIYNLRFPKFICRRDWFTASVSQTGIKFIVRTPAKFLIRNFIPNWRSVSTDNKRYYLVYLTFYQGGREQHKSSMK